MNNFDGAFDYLIKFSEGSSFTNDPKDPGGATKFGVTLKEYQTYIGRAVFPSEIKSLTIDQAKKFYLDRFWNFLNLDKIQNSAVSTCIFDNSVLYGPRTTEIMVQKALVHCGMVVKIDGFLGEESFKCLNSVDSDSFIKAINMVVLTHISLVLDKNPHLEIYRTGWMNRANRLLTLNKNTPVPGEA